MASRSKRVFLGCGLGCVGLIVVGISSCVGFQIWLNTPGEILEPSVLLDPDAVGWAQARLDLEDEGTEALASTLLQLTQPPEGMFEDSPFLAFLNQMNARRNQRQMRKLFPLVAAWSLYPEGGEGDEPFLITASVPRMAHTLTLIDWGLAFVARRQPELVTEIYRGERIVVITEPGDPRVSTSVERGALRVEREADLGSGAGSEADLEPAEESGEGGRPFTAFVFLRDVGVFFATSREAAHRAIDGVEGGPAQASGSPLERLISGLDDTPLRAAVVNDDDGRLTRVLERLLPREVVDDETRSILDSARSATLTGRFDVDGELVLAVTLAGLSSDEATLTSLRGAASRLVERSEVQGTVRVEAMPAGIEIALTLPIREAAERARPDWR